MSQERVRWNPAELKALAGSMIRHLGAAGVTNLEALRRAQDEVLPENRRREIKAWSVVSERLGEYLSEAHAAASADQSIQPSSESADAVNSIARAKPDDGESEPPTDNAENDRDVSGVSGREEGAAFDPLGETSRALESALIALLEKPAVVNAMTALIVRAFEQSGIGTRLDFGRSDQLIVGRRRILLAGFDANLAKSMESAFDAGRYDVRRWSAREGVSALRSMSRSCEIVVIPDNDDDLEEGLKEMSVVVYRHSGAVRRLVERIETAA